MSPLLIEFKAQFYKFCETLVEWSVRSDFCVQRGLKICHFLRVFCEHLFFIEKGEIGNEKTVIGSVGRRTAVQWLHRNSNSGRGDKRRERGSNRNQRTDSVECCPGFTVCLWCYQEHL
ncbi:MAG: hypothetical protein HUJ57_01620 [Erysipelotrichaceae bacterium]|nr:hypothetical protein [Erysipelotrichaceae bacterium]